MLLQPSNPADPTPKLTPSHPNTPLVSRDVGFPPPAPPFPAPQTPALQRLGHEVLPGFPLPAEQQHQPRAAFQGGHEVPTLCDPIPTLKSDHPREMDAATRWSGNGEGCRPRALHSGRGDCQPAYALPYVLIKVYTT